jgi:hypothetical protein
MIYKIFTLFSPHLGSKKEGSAHY